jgi:hypothetical protein
LNEDKPSAKERDRKHSRAYRLAHRDDIKKKDHLRYLKNRERNLARQKAYYQAHKPEREAYRQQYYPANRERIIARSADYRKAHLTKRRERELLAMYGWTQADYERVLAEQGGACAICRSKDWAGKWNRPQIDHDHNTNKPRGILCANCNTALGLINDDLKIAQAMLDYLNQFNVDAPITEKRKTE